MKKEKFEVKGIMLTEKEKSVYDFVQANGVVDYKAVAENLEISGKSASSTLARLQAVHGLLKKNEPVKATSYEMSNADANANADAE